MTFHLRPQLTTGNARAVRSPRPTRALGRATHLRQSDANADATPTATGARLRRTAVASKRLGSRRSDSLSSHPVNYRWLAAKEVGGPYARHLHCQCSVA